MSLSQSRRLRASSRSRSHSPAASGRSRSSGPPGPLVALALGVVLERTWPGDFAGRLLSGGGPAVAAWIAAVGGAAALVAAAVWRPRGADVRPLVAALSAAAFVLPVAVHGFARWSPADRITGEPLTAGLVQQLRDGLPAGAVVFADLETSYRVAAYAPVYVAAAPPAHVANTKANLPFERRRQVAAFLRTGDLAIPRSFGATWLVVAARSALCCGPGYGDARSLSTVPWGPSLRDARSDVGLELGEHPVAEPVRPGEGLEVVERVRHARILRATVLLLARLPLPP